MNVAHGGPGNVKGRIGVLGPWSKDKCVVDCGRFRQMEASRPALAHGQRIVGTAMIPNRRD
jgi:hypothetical protein